jgi:hypothetical protein
MNPQLPDLIGKAIRATAMVLMVLIVTSAGCVVHMHFEAAYALAHGADPIGVSCAINSTDEVCALAATRGSKTQ